MFRVEQDDKIHSIHNILITYRSPCNNMNSEVHRRVRIIHTTRSAKGNKTEIDVFNPERCSNCSKRMFSRGIEKKIIYMYTKNDTPSNRFLVRKWKSFKTFCWNSNVLDVNVSTTLMEKKKILIHNNYNNSIART